jgi:cytochrome P450
MIRILPQDTVIRGYNIPAGTMATWYTGVMGREARLFPSPEAFIPERWIDTKHEIHPFAVRNFSHGPRCGLRDSVWAALNGLKFKEVFK